MSSSKTNESSENGPMLRINVSSESSKWEYRYRFWGFPTGVVMLPRLAASVWQTTTGTIRSLRFTIRSSSRANGTKVIKDTSLVISMLEKKHRRIRSCSSCLSEWIRSSSNSPSCRKKPMFWRPVVAVIRPKSRISVCRSRYPRYSADGGMINMERTARARAMVKTVSFLRKELTFCIMVKYSLEKEKV